MVEKKSLISNHNATKKAVIASKNLSAGDRSAMAPLSKLAGVSTSKRASKALVSKTVVSKTLSKRLSKQSAF